MEQCARFPMPCLIIKHLLHLLLGSGVDVHKPLPHVLVKYTVHAFARKTQPCESGANKNAFQYKQICFIVAHYAWLESCWPACPTTRHMETDCQWTKQNAFPHKQIWLFVAHHAWLESLSPVCPTVRQ
eukprot:2523788-Amphidinium_carterae.1